MAPPIYVKGGVWTNVEDQILKAAVSKYGLTQWARVASLLPKKTAKQAKARWNEYLNPNINRKNWTSEDDDKLLSLAKLLPNQWRSISSMMGRTATHCVERYQKLLENAAKMGASGSGSESEEDSEINDMKMTGPGIESLPALGNAYESLPSRPDAENMDDDEREMLSEAKARLANTQGKKAKRKDRERMLEESKRVALLQKRRELKAAGINVSLASKNRAKRKEFDYNADIPHERIPKPGLYDVSVEDKRNEEQRVKFQKDVNFKGVSPKEETRKAAISFKKAAEADSKRVKANTRQAAKAVADLDSSHLAKRRKLELPLPGARLESEELKKQILAKSKDLLLAQNGNKAGNVLKTESQTTQLALTEKVSKKQIASTLRALLANVPQPKESTQVILPQFDTFLDINSADDHFDNSSVPVESSNIDQQIEIDRARARLARMLQKGLTIPDFSSVEVSNSEKGSIAEKVNSVIKALLKFDLLLEHDSLDMNTRLSHINDDMLAQVEKQIENEVQNLHQPEDRLVDIPHKRILPSSEAAISKAHDLLHSLNASSNEADQKSAILEDRNANELVFEELRQKVSENSQLIFEADLEESVLREIARNEDVSIERRSVTLQEKVDDIKLAENRAARVI